MSGKPGQGSLQSSDEASGPGWLLRRYRQEAGLTQRELRDKLEVRGFSLSETTVSMWENGERLPSDPTLFYHLRDCLSLSEAQETALALACTVELLLRYLEPYLALRRELGDETKRLLASLFESVLDRR